MPKGPREGLAKAVVLECAMLATKKSRNFHVLAFSGQNNLAEFSFNLESKNKKEGLKNLLDFLGSSFRGGTDVTSPLTRAIDLVQNSYDWAQVNLFIFNITNVVMAIAIVNASDTAKYIENIYDYVCLHTIRLIYC